MRILELLLIVVTAGGIFALAIFGVRVASAVIAIGCLVSVVALSQFAIEGYRWQIAPAYAGALLTSCLLLSPRIRRVKRRIAVGSVAAIACLVTGAILALVYPVFRLPMPTGPYRIGTLTYHLIDQRRIELFAVTPGAHREVMIQVWFPADRGASGVVERYRDPAITTWETAYLELVKTHAVRDVDIAKSNSTFPVVLFTPSWHGLRNQDMFVVENLVSHGFVIVGVDHPYGSGVTAFPDGRRILAPPDKFIDTSSESTLRDTKQIAEEQVRIRATDLVFVLDSLESLNKKGGLGLLTGRLDFSRVGVLGYSFGGAVAAEACWMDPRFLAALDLDGALFGEAAQKGIKQPFLMMTDSAAPPSRAQLMSLRPGQRRWARFLNDQDYLLSKTLATHGGYLAEIDGIAHGNFSDEALFSPVRWLTGSGRIDRYSAITIVREYSLAFFELSLRGVRQPLLEGPSANFSDVKLSIYDAPHADRHRAARYE
jgi:predicted dienelactone hydrolase